MRIAIIALVTVLAGCAHGAGSSTLWLDGVKYTPMGGANPGAFSAMLYRNTAAAATYTIRVHMTQGGRIMPHSHPDARVVTVVAGELCYGFSDTFDPEGCKAYPEGSAFVVPANVPHFGYGKHEAIYQESGVGPSGFVPVTK